MPPLPFRRTLIALAVSALVAGPALADPVGPQVRSGAAGVAGLGTGTVTVTATTPSTLIQWQSFQVGTGQSVNFVLPSASSTVLNQVIGNASFNGAVTPSAQVMFMQNGIVSGGGLGTSLDLGNSLLAALRVHRPRQAELPREGAARDVVAQLADGRVIALAPSRDDVSTLPSGDVVIAAGRSIELADAASPHLRVLVRAPAGGSLNLTQLLARARSTGVYGALVSQPRGTQRSETEAVQVAAREGRDAIDVLLAFLDEAATRIARLAEPVPDLLPQFAATEAPALAAGVQVASIAPVVPPANVAPQAKPAAQPAALDIEVMEARVASWQLALQPADTELMETAVSSWGLAQAPADLELMETRVVSWQSAQAPADTELMESRVQSWQQAVAPLDTELMEAGVASWQLARAPADTELMEAQVATWQQAAAPADTEVMETLVQSWQRAAAPLDTELMESQVASWRLAQAPSDIELMETHVGSWQLAQAPTDTELMEARVQSWQLAQAPADTELMESQVGSWTLAQAPADIELMETQVGSWQLALAPADTELMEVRVQSWQLARAPADTEVMESRVTSWQMAAAPRVVEAPVVVAERPVQLAEATERIVLPERRTAPPKLIRIEYKGSSFFM